MPQSTRNALALLIGAILTVLLVGSTAIYLAYAQYQAAKFVHLDIDQATIKQRQADLWQAAHTVLNQAELTRENHRVYTVDLAQLAIAAALADDRDTFNQLRDLLLKNVIVQNPDDPFTHGMVAWGYTANPNDATTRDQPLDASGTTEALRVIQALQLGIDRFHHDDLNLIQTLAHAYARHAVTEPHGSTATWYIRNYLNLQTRTFATNCFLIDLDPDLLTQLAERLDDDPLRDIAERSANLVARSQSPTPGLLHQMIRPEVATAMGPDYAIYSADGHEQINNVLTVAERIIHTQPNLAQASLDFALNHLTRHGLPLRFNVHTGQPVRDPSNQTAYAGPETYAPLLRLAIKLNDQPAIDATLPHLLRAAADLPESTHPAKLYALGETLYALQAWKQHQADAQPSSPTE